jgi:hypothetical protein
MAKYFVDLEFAKQFGLSEKDFSGKDRDGQEKILDEAYKKFKKTFALRNETEAFENAKTAIPKVKEFFQKPINVWVKPRGKEKQAFKVHIIGYSTLKDKVLAVKPESASEKLKVLQYDISEIILTADDLAKYQ